MFTIQPEFLIILSNLNSANTDGSFTMANLNSFSSPYIILQIAQENKQLRKFYPEILSWNCMLYVLIRFTSLRQF